MIVIFFLPWDLIHLGPATLPNLADRKQEAGSEPTLLPLFGTLWGLAEAWLCSSTPWPGLVWRGGYQANAEPHPTLPPHIVRGKTPKSKLREGGGSAWTCWGFLWCKKIRQTAAFCTWWSVGLPGSMKVSQQLAWSHKGGKSFINASICVCWYVCVSRHSAHKDSLVGNVG